MPGWIPTGTLLHPHSMAAISGPNQTRRLNSASSTAQGPQASSTLPLSSPCRSSMQASASACKLLCLVLITCTRTAHSTPAPTLPCPQPAWPTNHPCTDISHTRLQQRMVSCQASTAFKQLRQTLLSFPLTRAESPHMTPMTVRDSTMSIRGASSGSLWEPCTSHPQQRGSIPSA